MDSRQQPSKPPTSSRPAQIRGEFLLILRYVLVEKVQGHKNMWARTATVLLRQHQHQYQHQHRRWISRSVLIKGLPIDLSAKDLEHFAQEYGPVQGVKLIQIQEKYRSCTGIVEFQELDSALAVMDELQYTVLFGRRVELSFNRFNTMRWDQRPPQQSHSNKQNQKQKWSKENDVHGYNINKKKRGKYKAKILQNAHTIIPCARRCRGTQRPGTAA